MPGGQERRKQGPIVRCTSPPPAHSPSGVGRPHGGRESTQDRITAWHSLCGTRTHGRHSKVSRVEAYRSLMGEGPVLFHFL